MTVELDLERSVDIVRSPRVLQVESIFDVPPAKRSSHTWHATLGYDERPWQIGLIVGPSGSGKTSLLRDLFGEPRTPRWDDKRSVIDCFAEALTIREISGWLSSVGFSTAPAWMRPYSVLSNGEQFRVTVARLLAEAGPDVPVVVDEFTSVVDRQVAKVTSAAVAKAVRKRPGYQLVAASCHYDIIEWLQPDWTYSPGDNVFSWRDPGQRPDMFLECWRTDKEAWRLFGHHHYLSTDYNHGAKAFVGYLEGHPVAFNSIMPRAGHVDVWRGYRTIVLPDYQGVGLGHAFNEMLASVVKAAECRYIGTSGHPAMLYHINRSPLWQITRKPGLAVPMGRTSTKQHLHRTAPTTRLTASFEYVGPAYPGFTKAEARAWLTLNSTSGGRLGLRLSNRRSGVFGRG